jgi:hypothetical protein
MQEAAEELNCRSYNVVVTVSTPARGQNGGPMQKTSAGRAAEQLRKFGIDEHVIKVLAVSNTDRHRTYASALAVKYWLTESKIAVVWIKVFTSAQMPEKVWCCPTSVWRGRFRRRDSRHRRPL